MSFWQNVQQAAGMSGYFWVVLGFLVAAFVLFALVPAERRRVRGSVLLFALSFAGMLAGGTLMSYGAGEHGPASPLNTALRWTVWLARFIEAVAIINLTSVLLFDVLLDAIRLKPPRIMRDLLIAFTYIVAAITLLSQSGVDLTGIVATSAVITAVVGFSLQDTLGNIMGGMALQMERTIGVGDWVRIDQQEGMVKEIRWRQTSIETRNWDTIVIPNSVLMKGQVTLLGRRTGSPRQHRQWVYFNVDFRFAPVDVIDAVERALQAEPIPNVALEPKPHCIVVDFMDSYARYAARYWLTDLALTDPTDSVVRSRIYFALRRAGIRLSIPAQSLFITEEDSKRRERKRDEEIERRLETLSRVELFQSLTDEERKQLAAGMSVVPFARGEAITRQGAEAHWLYIMTKGEAEVRVAVDGNLSKKVATLHEGDFFGEMGLMTGEPRAATIIALTSVECYRLDKESFHAIISSRPEIAEDISHVLARRRVELDAVRLGLNEEAKRQRMKHAQGDLLRRITSFFTLEK
ncbi:MAG: mechanosensitive ion channel family protein [Pyrinomonadaceae bacterium]|nr:mechanosensitive ion channel family protein [Pyrinomonadaceae bacterium]